MGLIGVHSELTAAFSKDYTLPSPLEEAKKQVNCCIQQLLLKLAAGQWETNKLGLGCRV